MEDVNRVKRPVKKYPHEFYTQCEHLLKSLNRPELHYFLMIGITFSEFCFYQQKSVRKNRFNSPRRAYGSSKKNITETLILLFAPADYILCWNEVQKTSFLEL